MRKGTPRPFEKFPRTKGFPLGMKVSWIGCKETAVINSFLAALLEKFPVV